MRLVGQPTGRSVHRGTTGPCIELRNHFFAGLTLSCHGEGNSGVERHGESDVTLTESETTRTVGRFSRGSWEIPGTSISFEMDRSAKVRCRNSDMSVSGKSDSLVVPEKRANNAGQKTAAESVEERGLTKENDKQLLMVRTPSRVTILHGLFGVRVTNQDG
jgi:hypothetical protein